MKFVVKKKVISADPVPPVKSKTQIKKEENRKRNQEKRKREKERKGPNKRELLLAEGKDFFNFALPIDLMEKWIGSLPADKKPSEYLQKIIEREVSCQ